MMLVKLLAATLASCCLAIPVTFKADFRGRQAAPGGPHLVGSFQSWDIPSAVALADEDADGIYVATLDLPAGSYEFKFINGSAWEHAELVPMACSTADPFAYYYGYGDENAHRRLHIAENASSADMHACFNECEPCDALALCKAYDCPPYYGLKSSAWELTGESRGTCCDAVGSGKGSIMVRSAGYSDGNYAQFWLNWDMLYATGARGLTVVELRPGSLGEYIVKHTETFDTFVDSSKLEGYLSTVAAGNLILMAAVDEASAMLSQQAKALIASCGAESIQQMAFRSSYALIGQKGGSALSEEISPEGSGGAVAAATVALPDKLPPLCKMFNCFWGALQFVLKADALETPGNSQDACCEAAGPGEQSLVVRSAGYSDGNGQRIYATRTRGLTIVDLWPNMTVKHKETFDTFTDSSSMVAYLSSTANGNVILVGAVDEPSAAFSQEAENALRACGATFPQPLSFRSAYALIGIKGGGKLSEVVQVEGDGYAVAVAEVKKPEPVLTMCNLYNCPSGYVLSALAMETLGASVETCCEAMGPGEQALVVRSAGFSDGNRAEFWLNGQRLYETRKRGLTVVDLWPNMTVKRIETFDTHADSLPMAAYLNSTAKGNVILVGASDDASAGMGWEAANQLRDCGATFPRPLCFRCSYTLIGVKGGSKLAEVVTKPGKGKAVSVSVLVPELLRFLPVDGGVNRACRGQSAGDNSGDHYVVVDGIETLQACKLECIRREAFVGIEHRGSRCEVWTRPGGVQASIYLYGYTCLSYTPPLATTATTTMASTATTSTRAIATRFAAVDGGVNRACRGASSSDNAPSHYTVIPGIQALGDCQTECIQVVGCVGIEFSSGRCEVWIRPDGIQASIALNGFTCLSYTPPLATTTLALTATTSTRAIATRFAAVDGGVSRACRGASSSDNAPSHYTVIPGIQALGDCQAECLQVVGCVGIEFSSGRCEVWIRPDGIQASIALTGFTCQRLVSASRRLDMVLLP
ncbi:Cemip [Symbiodinium microadriaticum]|nr:Cemip [Symbiodinium microadriaticum]